MTITSAADGADGRVSGVFCSKTYHVPEGHDFRSGKLILDTEGVTFGH